MKCKTQTSSTLWLKQFNCKGTLVVKLKNQEKQKQNVLQKKKPKKNTTTNNSKNNLDADTKPTFLRNMIKQVSYVSIS